jgi:quinol monooxygenase YgiN
MSDTIIVTGIIDLDPAKHDEAVAAMIELMDATRTEAGNEAYTFSADVADPGRFHVVEQWASAEAMNAYMAAPHLAAFMDKMSGFSVTGTSFTKWEGAIGSKVV